MCARDGEDLSDGRESMQARGSGRVTVSPQRLFHLEVGWIENLE